MIVLYVENSTGQYMTVRETYREAADVLLNLMETDCDMDYRFYNAYAMESDCVTETNRGDLDDLFIEEIESRGWTYGEFDGEED